MKTTNDILVEILKLTREAIENVEADIQASLESNAKEQAKKYIDRFDNLCQSLYLIEISFKTKTNGYLS